MNTFVKLVSLFTILLALSACGGGGGGSSDPGPTTPPMVTDADSDGVENASDNCPDDANASQADLDMDGLGDVCDDDDDADGVEDGLDNCPNIPNANQSDFTMDGVGDVCDDDDDNDGVLDINDIDKDDDGLIEIATLEELDWMRNDPTGQTLTDHDGNVLMDGCFGGACNGYELIADLDFDTNGDGLMDINDTYFDYDGDGTNKGWLPIGRGFDNRFAANFDGNGYAISNLYINRPLENEVGLFGSIFGLSSSPEIKSIALDGPLMEVTGLNLTGSLVGLARQFVTISDNHTSGDVTGGGLTGGLVGRALSSVIILDSSASGEVAGLSGTGGLVGSVVQGGNTIENSFSTGNVSGAGDSTGGLVGEVFANATISDSSASGDVSGTGDNTGGLVGSALSSLTISNSLASGSVIGSDNTGGLVGLARSGGAIENSFATGDVSGGNSSGGLIGSVNFDGTPYTNVSERVAIQTSFATGAVTTTDNIRVGGLIGLSYNLALEDCFATGAVSDANQFVGGLIGNANDSTTISRCFSANPVSGTSDVGALVGYSDEVTYEDNYFANDTNPGLVGVENDFFGNVGIATDVSGDTLSALQSATSAGENGVFTDWSDSIWDFGSSTQLPGLIIDGTLYRDGNADGVLD